MVRFGRRMASTSQALLKKFWCDSKANPSFDLNNVVSMHIELASKYNSSFCSKETAQNLPGRTFWDFFCEFYSTQLFEGCGVIFHKVFNLLFG